MSDDAAAVSGRCACLLTPVAAAASGTDTDSGDPTAGNTTSPDPTATSRGMGESTYPPPPIEGPTTGDLPLPDCESTDCEDNDICATDACNEATTSREHTVAPDEPCNDDNECTSPDVCQPNGPCSGDPSCAIERCGTIDTDEICDPGLVHLLTCSAYVEGPGNPVLYEFVGPRNGALGTGLSCGRYGPQTNVRRHPNAPMLAYALPAPRKSFLRRVFWVNPIHCATQ